MKSPLWVSVVLLSFLPGASCFSQSSGTEGAVPANATGLPGSSQAGGVAPSSSSSSSAPSSTTPAETTIPGPLRSFQRMAGISAKASPEEVLPILAHEMNVRGYVRRRPTEYLALLRRYLQQARQLVALAGPEAVIRVSNCADAGPLLEILGYRLHQACGPET